MFFFQERVGKPFIRLIKDNIFSLFRSSSKDLLSAVRIFYPKKVPSFSIHELPFYGNSSIQTLNEQFGRDLPAKSLEGSQFEMATIAFSDRSTERKTYVSSLLSSQKMIYIHVTEGITNQWHAYSIILQST